MSAPGVVEAFYSQIWNRGDLAASAALLSRDFRFRGSLGAELRGHDAFRDYVQSVRGALADYHCEILDCVTEQNKAFAKLRFSGIHVAPFRGYQPTGKPVHWLGAALFLVEGSLISELWVLGDLVGLDALLEANAKSK
jgi:predicted ester cyclase